MTGRADLLENLRQLVELDRAFGVDFFSRVTPPPASATPSAGSAALLPTTSSTPPLPRATATAAPAQPTIPAPPVATPVPVAVPVAAPSGLPAGDLASIALEVNQCTRCKLCKGRITAVPGEGAPGAELLFIGEGPGADEDTQGRPFVGAAGQLLNRMITAMGLQRGEVYITNVVKCRPPQNRVPEPDEIASCMPYLQRQIAVIRPKVICTLGNTPLRALLDDPTVGITRQHGRILNYAGYPLIPTFHPSYLLRNAEAKKPCWEDLQIVLKQLGRTAPGRSAT
jgi:uracil-DNA glycosylase family 4